MKKEEFEKDIKLLEEKSPEIYNDIAKVSTLFYRIHRELHTGTLEHLKSKHNILLSELDLLSSLFYSGGDNYTLSPTQLIERLLFSSGGMTKALKRLESKDLICRIENSEDKRVKLVSLTPKGVELAQEGLKDALLFEEEYFSELNKDEQEKLSMLLLKCLKK